jgi:hypothetical protein
VASSSGRSCISAWPEDLSVELFILAEDRTDMSAFEPEVPEG